MTFPGQGSQTVGMGRALSDDCPAARQVLEEVDDVLGEKLSDIIWNGPPEQLTLTANAQPALMAVSIATIRAMENKGFDLARHISFVSGHSLGEYSALCAAGSISLADTARLLKIRGNAMQTAVPAHKGAMAAIIGMAYEDVQTICNQVLTSAMMGFSYANPATVENQPVSDPSATFCCQIANDNGGGQLVISGSRPEVEKVSELAIKQGAKRAIPLPVSAPFHCSLMSPAKQVMQEALATVNIQRPTVPLVANVLASAISDPEKIRHCLVEQVTSRVRWRESVMWMVKNGVTHMIECGAGKVLTGLARRISRDLDAVAIGTPDDILKAKSLWMV